MAFDLPAGRVFDVESVDLRLDPVPHALEVSSCDGIDANWLREKAVRPELHDGRIALFSQLTWQGGALRGRCHIARYATFLYWRAGHERTRAGHLYAHAVLAAADGPLVAVQMAGHTLNAGRVYFAAGSLEPEDFVAGRADLDANMRREVLEETGLDIAEMEAEPRMQALSIDTGTVVFRRYRSNLASAELADRIAAHAAAEAMPEIAGPIIIANAEPVGLNLSAQMPAILRWHFENPQ